MAVTLRRWVIGTCLGCLALAAVLLPPRASQSLLLYVPWVWFSSYSFRSATAPEDPLTSEQNRLTRAVGAASRDWVAFSWRDSIVSDRGRIARVRGQNPGIVVRAPVSRQRQEVISSALARAWEHLPRRNPEAWTLVVIIPDSVPQPGRPGLPPVTIRTPLVLSSPLLDDHGCVLLIPSGAINGSRVRATVLDAISPCAWRAAFGPPSSPIAGWLARSEWALGDGVDWEGGLAEQGRTINYQYLTEEWASSYDVPGIHVSRLASILIWDGQLDAAACLTGRTEACGRYVTVPSRPHGPAGLVGRRPLGRYFLGAGVISVGFLEAVLREAGPERFQAFWSTSAPIDSAFRTAVGTPVDQWTRRLVESRVGPAAWGTIGAGPMLASVLVALVLVGLAVATAGRREVR